MNSSRFDYQTFRLDQIIYYTTEYSKSSNICTCLISFRLMRAIIYACKHIGAALLFWYCHSEMPPEAMYYTTSRMRNSGLFYAAQCLHRCTCIAVRGDLCTGVPLCFWVERNWANLVDQERENRNAWCTACTKEPKENFKMFSHYPRKSDTSSCAASLTNALIQVQLDRKGAEGTYLRMPSCRLAHMCRLMPTELPYFTVFHLLHEILVLTSQRTTMPL